MIIPAFGTPTIDTIRPNIERLGRSNGSARDLTISSMSCNNFPKSLFLPIGSIPFGLAYSPFSFRYSSDSSYNWTLKKIKKPFLS